MMSQNLKDFIKKMREGTNLLSEATELWEANEEIVNFMLNENIKYSEDLPSFDDLVSQLINFVDTIENQVIQNALK